MFPLLPKTTVWAAVLLLSTLFAFSCEKPSQLYAEEYLNFPRKLSADTPYDVDPELEKRLMAEGKVDDVQRMFDILSWQLFIAMNWPRDEKNQAAAKITGNGNPIWIHWKESFEVFKEDGSKPSAWGSESDYPLSAGFNLKPGKTTRLLFRTNKFADLHSDDIANEIDQAFTQPIWDQNGNIVRYEIRMNQEIVDYLIANELYNINGQVAFSKAQKKVNFPSGTRDKMGVMELKLAWKIIDPEKDFPERYYTSQAYVLNQNGTYSLKTVGLVGMHIATKTQSSPQWIWATFEHVDNLETNPLTKIKGKALKPSFYDQACATCPVNKYPDTNAKVIKNQIQRVLPIPMATQELNQSVQKLLKKQGSVFQYYQLIGTQWPTDPSAPPYPNPSKVYLLPDAVANKSGGKPVPVFLTNMIMETYFQGGTVANPQFLDSLNAYLGNEPAYFQIEGFPKNIDVKNTRKLIFGTEGCAGCHSSASIAVDIIRNKANNADSALYGPPRLGDFEWLMQLKAHFKKK